MSEDTLAVKEQLKKIHTWTDPETGVEISPDEIAEFSSWWETKADIMDGGKRLGGVRFWVGKKDNPFNGGEVIYQHVDAAERAGQGVFTRYQEYVEPLFAEIGVNVSRMNALTDAGKAFCEKTGWTETEESGMWERKFNG